MTHNIIIAVDVCSYYRPTLNVNYISAAGYEFDAYGIYVTFKIFSLKPGVVHDRGEGGCRVSDDLPIPQ